MIRRHNLAALSLEEARSVKIGEGLTSDVFCYSINGIEVVMKKFKDSCSTTNRRQEIKAYEEISSPLVVSPLKLTDDFLLLEKFGDCSLLEYLLSNSLSYSQIQHIFRQIVAAIEQLHRQGFLHRDIKPDNVLLDSCTFGIKLCDLGFACRRDEPQVRKAGTAGYMAPELFDVQQKLEKAETFALGVLLFNMMARRMPFANRVSCKNLKNIRSKNWAEFWLDNDVVAPAQMRALAQNMLSWDPAERPCLKEVAASDFVTLPLI